MKHPITEAGWTRLHHALLGSTSRSPSWSAVKGLRRGQGHYKGEAADEKVFGGGVLFCFINKTAEKQGQQAHM